MDGRDFGTLSSMGTVPSVPQERGTGEDRVRLDFVVSKRDTGEVSAKSWTPGFRWTGGWVGGLHHEGRRRPRVSFPTQNPLRQSFRRVHQGQPRRGEGHHF